VVPNDLRLGPPVPLPDPHRPQRGGKTVALKTLGLLTLMAMAGLSIPPPRIRPCPIFHNLFVAVGTSRASRGTVHLLRPHPAAERDLSGRIAVRWCCSTRSSRGRIRAKGRRSPARSRNAGGQGGARGGDDALRGTEGDRLHGHAIRERLDAFDGEHHAADVPAVAGCPRPFDGDGDRAVPRPSRTRSWNGRKGTLRARPGPDGGDRPPGAERERARGRRRSSRGGAGRRRRRRGGSTRSGPG